MVVTVVEMAQHEKGPSYSVIIARMPCLRCSEADRKRGVIV
jgi:hypothetical protein